MNKAVLILLVLLGLWSGIAEGQYDEGVHLTNFDCFFAKDYVLRKIFGQDKNILRTCDVKSAITTNEDGNIIYDSMKFDERGNILRHVVLNSDLRNDFDGFLNYHIFQDKIYNVQADEQRGLIEFTKSDRQEINRNTGFPAIDYRIIITSDTLKYILYTFEGPWGEDYKVEMFEPNYSRIKQFTETRSFAQSFEWKGKEHPRYFYEYDSELKLTKVLRKNNSFDTIDSLMIDYKQDTIIFSSGDLDEEWLTSFPELGRENYIIKEGRIFRKEVIFPHGKYFQSYLEPDYHPYYINTEYHYKDNGLIDYTITDYAENSRYYPLNGRTYKEGSFIKYYQYEFYKK